MHIATHARVLSRRALIKGIGTSIGLPLLDAMTPVFAQTAANASPPRRFIAMNASLGFHGPYFFPNETGSAYTPTPYLDVLKELRGDFTVFSGLSHPEQSGNNGHASELTWLTAAKRPGLAGFKNSVSLDQFIAGKIGVQTRFPYLALANNGSSLSWTNSGVQIPGEQSPAKIFKQLFIEGSPAEVQEQVAGLQRGRSILDTVNGEAKKLHRDLGKRDQEKLDQYLTSVRDLETRLVQNEAWTKEPKPKVDAKPPTDISDRNDTIGRTLLMNDLIVLALQTDSTRTITFNLGGLNSVPVIQGVQTDWHNLSHHGQDPKKIEELKLIELAEFGAFRDFLAKLKSVQENGRPLLDTTSVLFGSNLGNASAHDWHNLPILVAGGGFKHGQHLASDPKNNTPFSNLFVQIAQRMGIEVDAFGSSTKAAVPGFEPA
jgi:hypothetical protein